VLSWIHDPDSDVSHDVPYQLLQFCASWTSSINTFSSNGSRIEPLSLFSALVDNPASLLLYNNSTGYWSSSESCSNLLQSCATVSINIFCHTWRTSSHFASMSPLSSTMVIIHQICRLSDKNAVRQMCFLGLLARSLPDTLRLIDDHAAFQWALKTYLFSVAFSS